MHKAFKYITSAALAATLMGGAAQAQDLTIATSLPNLGFPFFVHMQKELQAEAESLGGITLVETDGDAEADGRR
jgi:inositol transport system substrate-binding protein